MAILLAREDKIENFEEMNYRKTLGIWMLYLIYGLFFLAILNSIIAILFLLQKSIIFIAKFIS